MCKDTKAFEKELGQIKNTEEFIEFLKRNEDKMKRESFGDCVLRLCEKYGMTASSLQPQIAISKSQFYSILNGTRHPSKESVIKIAFGLQATRKELNELLRIVGYHALEPQNKEDAIIIFGLEQKKEVGKVDELLREYKSKIRLSDKE